MAESKTLKRQIGAFQWIRERFFGQKADDLKIEDHARPILRIGRILAPVVIVVFSVAFAVQLTGDKFQQVQNDVSAGNFFSAALIIVIATILGIVILDFTMIVMFTQVRDHLSRKESFSIWWAKLAWGLLVCAIEGGTFLWMLIDSEKNAGFWQIVLDAGRAFMTPGGAVILTIVPDRVLTPEEAIRFVFRKVAATCIKLLEDMQIHGSASFQDLMAVFFKLAAFKFGDDPKALLEEIRGDLEKLAPNAMAQEIATWKARAAQAEARVTQVLAQVEDRLAEAERNAARRVAEVGDNWAARLPGVIQTGIYNAAIAGVWSEEMLQLAPGLANVPVPSFGGGRGAARVSGAASARMLNPGTAVGQLRAALMGLGVAEDMIPSEIKTKERRPNPSGTGTVMIDVVKKPKAAWVTAAAIPLMCDPTEPLDGTDARETAKKCGGGQKVGTTYAAPALAVIKELKRIKRLHPDLAQFANEAATDESAAESEEIEA